MSRLSVDLEDFKVVGKSNDQLRFDVKLYLDDEVDSFMLLKGYRLMGGKVSPPSARAGAGGFYTIVQSAKVEQGIRKWLMAAYHLHSKFSSIEFPLDKTRTEC